MLDITKQSNVSQDIEFALLYRKPTLYSIFHKVPSIINNLYKIAINQIKLIQCFRTIIIVVFLFSPYPLCGKISNQQKS